MRFLAYLTAACSAVALLASPASAQVPAPYARELAAKLGEADQLVAREGYFRAAGPFAGGLAAGATGRHMVTLRAGQAYRLVAVCDDRCADLDLRVRDVSGAEIAEDHAANAVPVLDLRPLVSGSYAIEAEMARCGADLCWYALNIYTR